MKDSFLIYNSMKAPLLALSDSDLRQIMIAIFEYHETGSEPQLSGALNSAWLFLKSQFDRDGARYEAVCHRNRQNGTKGGRPKKTQDNPENPVGYLGTQKTQGNPEEPQKADTDTDTDLEESILTNTKENEFSLKGEIVSEEKPPRCGRTVFTFDEFWTLYDLKRDKAKCEKAYRKIRESQRLDIKMRLPEYVKTTYIDGRFPSRKNPFTWLNGRCWEDESLPAPDAVAHETATMSPEDEFAKLLNRGK